MNIFASSPLIKRVRRSVKIQKYRNADISVTRQVTYKLNITETYKLVGVKIFNQLFIVLRQPIVGWDYRRGPLAPGSLFSLKPKLPHMVYKALYDVISPYLLSASSIILLFQPLTLYSSHSKITREWVMYSFSSGFLPRYGVSTGNNFPHPFH